MKIKFWEFEYEFDKNDAQIVVPFALLLISLSATEIKAELLLAIAAVYYLFYFFFRKALLKIRKLIPAKKLKCPACKSTKMILQGYQPFQSDEYHAYYLCMECQKTSILTEGGLT